MMHNSYHTLSVTVNAFWSEYLARKSIVIWRIKNMCVCVCVEGEVSWFFLWFCLNKKPKSAGFLGSHC